MSDRPVELIKQLGPEKANKQTYSRTVVTRTCIQT